MKKHHSAWIHNMTPVFSWNTDILNSDCSFWTHPETGSDSVWLMDNEWHNNSHSFQLHILNRVHKLSLHVRFTKFYTSKRCWIESRKWQQVQSLPVYLYARNWQAIVHLESVQTLIFGRKYFSVTGAVYNYILNYSYSRGNNVASGNI